MVVNASDDQCPEFKREHVWSRIVSSHYSIAEQAVSEPASNIQLLAHFWDMITVLHLVMVGNLRSVKPLALFDTKGKHAFGQPLHAMIILSSQFDEKIHSTRQTFCLKAVTSLVKNHITLTINDQSERLDTADMLLHTDTLLELSRNLLVNEDEVRIHLACELYASSLDRTAKEAALYIADKELFSTRMMLVIGSRLACKVLSGDAIAVSKNISNLPTRITTWLQSMDSSQLQVEDVTISETLDILHDILSDIPEQSKEHTFASEVLESFRLIL